MKQITSKKKTVLDIMLISHRELYQIIINPNGKEVKTEMKKLLSATVLCAFVISLIVGCTPVCKNGPNIAASLSNTIATLKATADELNTILQKGYDAEIALAYAVAQTSLTAAQALLAQNCPDPTAVNAVATTTEQEVQPKAAAAKVRAKKLGIIK